MGRGSGVFVCMLLASAVTPCGSISRAERPPADEIQAVADRVLAATVSIACSGEGGSFSGSGVVVTAEGHVLTAASVVPKGAAEVTVLLPGYRRRPAAIAVLDESLGITLLKVPTEEPLDFLPLARDPPAVGDTVFTAADIDDVMLANGRASLSRGVVSGIYGIERQAAAVPTGHVIETSAAVNRGSNGGPLVDADGRVVGVISLAVSPRRWQGVAVPATAILDSLFPASRGVFPVRIDDATAPAAAPPLDGLRRSAAEIARFLVGIEVERTWPPEKLPRVSWSDYRTSVADWEKLTDDERRRQFAAYGVRSAMLDVNQLLRRPPGAVTGLVVSGDGFVLTSSFNIGDDTVFVGQASGRPRTFGGDESLEAMLAEPEGGVAPRPNAIRRVTVVCADGSRREARVHARHEPLGVALLKIEAKGLPFFNFESVTSPQVGDPVAAVGVGDVGTHTLNPGMVSAASRNRGYRFQTDALVNYGNSGGPVVDATGSLLGIATAPIEPDTVMGRIFPLHQLMRWSRAPNSGVGFVARADRLRAVLEDLKAGKSFERFPGPFLGVQADESKALGDDVVIGVVAEGSPAARAGLKAGDIVLAYDGVELSAWREFTERIAAGKPGEQVVLTIRRKQKGPRLVVSGQDIETVEDLERLRKSLQPGDTFEGRLVADDLREVTVVLGESK